MNDTIEQTETVRYKKRRCWSCGRWWAYEWFEDGTPVCPVCAGKTIADMRDTIEKQERSIRALRGAVRRMRATR